MCVMIIIFQLYIWMKRKLPIAHNDPLSSCTQLLEEKWQPLRYRYLLFIHIKAMRLCSISPVWVVYGHGNIYFSGGVHLRLYSWVGHLMKICFAYKMMAVFLSMIYLVFTNALSLWDR